MKERLIKPRRSLDRRIHLEHPGEAAYWSKKFEVSCTQIFNAIIATGSNKADRVAEYISRQMIWVVYK